MLILRTLLYSLKKKQTTLTDCIVVYYHPSSGQHEDISGKPGTNPTRQILDTVLRPTPNKNKHKMWGALQ